MPCSAIRARPWKHARTIPALAAELAHANTVAVGLAWSCIFHQILHDQERAHRQAEAVIALAAEQGFPLYLAAGRVIRGWAHDGEPQEAIAEIHQGLSDYWATGADMWSPYFLGLLAEAYGRGGMAVVGLGHAEEALERISRTRARWIEAELYRIKGELLKLTPEGRQEDAETCFCTAMRVAREQGSKLWELRATTRIARLLGAQGARAEARDSLVPILGAFDKFEISDVVEANSLLEELR